jgi:hypothetical protein
MAIDTVIPSTIQEQPARGVAQLSLECAEANRRPLLGVQVTFGAENGSSVRRCTLRVVNRRGVACVGVFLVGVSLGLTEDGAPGGTQTLSVAKGQVFLTAAANVTLLVFTARDGTAEIDITVTGAGTRHVRAWAIAASDANSASWV